MDQVKEILRQAIKYRFWIAVGISALLPMIAYFVGVGPIQTQAATETGKITSAEKDVKQYTGGAVINGQYKPAVAEKTEALSKDVQGSWKKLYARQAPLLSWPKQVHDRFTAWGRQWPKDVDPSAIQTAIIDYVTAYPDAVHEVYETFKPFHPEDGTGVVSAPPEEALLRPAKFTIESPPSLGKVWAAQERLWIQRTLLEVVAEVNKGAKDWDGAVIKQINGLEVGSALAQDQRSIAKGETLEEAPDINDPNKPEEAPAESSSGGSSEMMAMMSMMGGSGGQAGPTDAVSYIKTEGENNQFKIMPVELSVLIDQSHIQDLLVGLENSPMTIQVRDFEMQKPTARVVKPEKGQSMMAYGGMMMSPEMMMGGMMRMMGGPRGVEGFGGRMMSPEMMMGGMMPGMGGPAVDQRKGVDARSKNRAKEFAERVKAAKSVSGTSLHDPYYNIVEVKVYGQARFFNPPPAEEAAPSQAEGAAPAGDEAAKKDEAPKPEGEAKAEPGATPGDEAAKKDAEPKGEGEAAKKSEGEAAKKDEPAPKAEPADQPKADAPKAEGEKAKDEAPKPEEPKADAPKADAPKAAEPAKAGAGAEAPPKK